ncbi:uncharacterized protein LOC122660117 [Telopea speciosissima]|uniref:uncharacterized protein LOC122660117 n=1 Tax=Telopea speciosissima TaxID=54955 RepID=UPI001CC4F700|nr:uncharacterized protein LOC122660117 [Telopea speciosissima]
MGKVVEKKKKKKGRPSLLDLQKRNLRQQQEQHQQQQQKQNPRSNPYSNSNYRNPIVSSPNPNPNPNPNRRLTRRNPYPDGIPAADSEGAVAVDEEDDDDDEDSNGKRKEKKLKFVLRRLPSNQQPRSSLNSSLNSGSYASDSNAEDENSGTPHKKRKINVVRDGSGPGDVQKGENAKSASKGEESESPLESGPTTPLPDKKLLVFILDRLQKKDTYGVFSDPVNPDELPDYHEVIEHPMDFGTVRKKLAGGAYANLEQFEKDVLLICSNAMKYNAPDTIYYRQARSMLELAQKNFDNLRQDSEDNEPEPKVVRRGRPPTKHLKKQLGKPPFERAGSEFSSDATLATLGDNSNWQNNYDQRKGSLSDRTGLSDASGRIFHGSHNSEAYTSWLNERKYEKNEEFPGSGLKGMSVKYGKKQFVSDESRRNTYKQFHPSVVGCKPSVFTVFDGEPKQLMTVGLQAEFGYARSLARFAANLGPVAWKVASQKIERALPPGLQFGPGWVGENEAPQPRPQVQAPSPPVQLLPHSSSLPKILASTATSHAGDPKAGRTSEKDSSNNSASDGIHCKPPPPSTAASSAFHIRSRTPEPTTVAEAAGGLNYDSGFSLLNSSGGTIKPRPPFQIHQSPPIQNTMNGLSGGIGFNVSPQMGKLLRPGRPAGTFGSEATMASGMVGMVARSNNFAHSTPVGHSESEDKKLSASSNTVSSGVALPDSNQESQLVPGVVHRKTSWGGLSLHQKTDSVPPDLNVRFQSPGSPSSSVPVDSPQPDLVLQL